MSQSPQWKDLIKIKENLYEIPRSFRADMRGTCAYLFKREICLKILKKIYRL